MRKTCFLSLFLLVPALFAGGETPEASSKKVIENGVLRVQNAGLFDDTFESGNISAWIPESQAIPNCNCYFSGDCKANEFCYWGPGGPGTEDNCNWRLPKPQGLPGKGCSTDVGSPGPICDGFCTQSTAGSPFGYEPSWLVVEGIQLWAEAMMRPARAGGGPVDADLAAAAMALPFHQEHMNITLGRHVADVLTLAGGLQFYDFFCHHENDMMTPDFYVDLSGDPCTADVAKLLIEGLVAELESPGSADIYAQEIRRACPDWDVRMPLRCMPGEGSDDCMARQLSGFALYLSIPRPDLGGNQ